MLKHKNYEKKKNKKNYCSEKISSLEKAIKMLKLELDDQRRELNAIKKYLNIEALYEQ